MLIHLFLLIIPTLILCQTVINIQSKDFCPSKTSQPKTRIPRIQIRSVLVRCPNRGQFHIIKSGSDDRTNLSVGRTQDLLEFFGYDSDEPLLHSEVTNCRRKLVVTIQITNCGKTKTEEEFILIDQVYDPVWKQRIRLLNPVVFKIKQKQVEQSFGLIIQHIVNAEATEKVISKVNKSFTGCSTSGLRPTCGYSYYHDQVIPYSEGFCCSCDPYVNVLRQPETLRIPPLSPVAFSTREGQFPQGKQNKKKAKMIMKRKTQPTLKDSIDEIFENFATKIKSYMYPANRRVSQLKANEHNMMDVRPHRSLFRLSPKYYKIPPLNPAIGFRLGDIQNQTKPGLDPWSIPLTLNATQKEQLKNYTCLSFNHKLSKYSPEKRIIRSWEWEPEMLDDLLEPGLFDELFESEHLSNSSILELLRNLLLSNEKRSIFTHYLDPGNAESQLLAQPLKIPLDSEELNAMEHFVKKIKKLNNSEWVESIVNPYNDTGVLCRPNYTKLFQQLARKSVKKLNESDGANHIMDIYSDPGVIYGPNYTNTFDQLTMSKGRTKNENLKNHKNLRKYFKKRRSKRQITSSGAQIRGGQSCLDRHVPLNANPETYHESAHCLQFSELWYNVYRLKTPFITHTVNFQLFDKITFEAGLSHWEDLTKGMRIQLGTFNRHTVNSKHDPTLVFTYTPLTDILKEQFCLDPLITTLLVPRPMAKEKVQNYPQILGGPAEYLLVRAQDISYDGEDCDKAGVGFKAFAKQPERCDSLKGTCLGNQPNHLWKYDIDAKKNGKPGKYFLENYAKVSEEPIRFHKEVGDFLSLDFTGSYQSVVEVEVPIDRNGLVRADSTAQLSEIYIDSTCEHQTRITVLVTNTGLTSSAFYPRMKGCPPEIPQVWTENEGPLVYIAPQKVHKYRLSLYGKLPVTRFHCSIELMNKKKQLVATRRIRIQSYDRCICMWHCLCACIGSVSGLKCDHMSLEHYHAAGFSGALPVDTEDPAYERADCSVSPFVLKDFLLYVFYIYLIFLIMGFLKFLLGLLFVTVANYGMWLLFECEAKHMTKYKESFWALTHLVRDSESFPISPAGRSRQIQILSKPAQAVANIFFFCIFPGIVLLKLPCAFCNVCCKSFLLLKMELLKTEWIRNCCAQPCCIVISRCIRRTKRSFRKNFWLPLCCCLNPFFLYSLCRSTSKGECNENKEENTRNDGRCRIHRQPRKENNEEEGDTTTVQYINYMFPTQHGNKDEIEWLLPSQIGQSQKRHKTMNKNPFSVPRDIPKNFDEIFTNVSSYVVKTSDYPNLDKKSIKYVVKNVKKGFNNVMNQVIKVYKAQKHKQDTLTLMNEVEEMKNKMMRNVISNISKTAIREILHNKYGMNEKNSGYERAEVIPIAEQVVALIDRCFQEIVNRKTDGAKLAKLKDYR